MDVNEAFALISSWPDLPPYDEGIGVGGAFRDTAYAVMSGLLPECRDEDDLCMAIAKGQLDQQWRGDEGLANYWRSHRMVHAAVRKPLREPAFRGRETNEPLSSDSADHLLAPA